MTDYQAFLASKRFVNPPSGIEVDLAEISDVLYDFQRDAVQWALRHGRAAIFQDSGLVIDAERDCDILVSSARGDQFMKEAVNRMIRDEKGRAMELVLILLTVGSLIMAPLLGLMSTGLLAGQVYEMKTDELYAPDAGVKDAIWKIEEQWKRCRN